MQSERAETTSTASPTHPALLLVGPTGSGKTPLGEVLAARGLGGRRCLHFDFGAELRRAAADESDLSEKDRTFIRRVLEEGALLEPERYPVAERLLTAFLRRHFPEPTTGHDPPLRSQADAGEVAGQGGVRSEDPRQEPASLLVLNGLPRHVQQAEAMHSFVDIRAVVELCCSPETVLERVRRNTGGDRSGRVDDDAPLVRRKLALYEQRTAPLVAHYRRKGASVLRVAVDVETTPERLAEVIRGRLCYVFCYGASNR